MGCCNATAIANTLLYLLLWHMLALVGYGMTNVVCVGLIEIPQQAFPQAAQGQQMVQLLGIGEETDSGVRNERQRRGRQGEREWQG